MSMEICDNFNNNSMFKNYITGENINVANHKQN